MGTIKQVKLFANHNQKSEQLRKYLEQELVKNGFLVVNDHPDLAIAIGGDGSFLRMIHQNDFDTSCYYVGLHAGTLGFLQELSIQDIPEFIEHLKQDDYYKYPMDIQKTTITTDHNVYTFLSLNEMVVRKANLKALKLNIYVDNHLLEFFAGDGILISTSIGSTAYNMSYGGSLVDSSLQTMQITPIAPLINCHYHNLQNSFIIPDWKRVMMNCENEDLVFTFDGQNVVLNHVQSIEVEIVKDKLSCIYYKNIDTATKIREKLIKE